VTEFRRLAFCGRYRAEFVADAVRVRVDEAGTARYSGLQVCGLVWVCPVCSAAIREERAREVERAGQATLAAGGELFFVTLTLPHRWDDGLDELLRIVGPSWTDITRSRGWRGLKFEIGGLDFVRAVEVTHGRNGWHPHLHVLLMTGAQITRAQLLELRSVITEQWADAVVRRGGRRPGEGVGVRVDVVGRGAEALAQYLLKVQDKTALAIGREMTRGDVKKGRRVGSRSAFEILEGAVRGRGRDRELWAEYERATAGRRCLTWSHGIKARLGLDELTDQAAAEEAPGLDAAVLNDTDWDLVQTYKRDTSLLDAVELAIASGGRFDLAAWLRPLRRRAEFDERIAVRRLARAGLLDGGGGVELGPPGLDLAQAQLQLFDGVGDAQA